MAWEWMLFIASACLMWGYVILMIARHGTAEVVSEYAYKDGMTAFTVCLGGGAALLMPVMVELAPDGFQFLGFGAAAALGFVAAAPRYREEESKIHNAAAAVAGALAVLWTLCVEPWAVLLGLSVLVWCGGNTRKYWLCAELGALVMVYTAAAMAI